jgi:ERO1-like protein beta
VCGNRACAVDTLDSEEDIPPIWRAQELSKLEGLHAHHPGRQQQKERPEAKPLQGMLGDDVDESCVVEYDDECDERDYCVPEDEGATAKGDYVSLVNNTERFTGYAGAGANQVWDAIYSENCFLQGPPQASSFGISVPPGAMKAVKGIRSVMQGPKTGSLESDNHELGLLNEECLEQRAFYRIISGMHASISAHICWDYFNQATGEWVRNPQCYKERLHQHPDRVSNLYFNYALVTRAVAKLQKHLQHYTFCLGDPSQDHETKRKVLDLVSHIKSAPNSFDESLMFQDPALLDLKEDFRNRFRNVSQLMDCVGCDKCRLWGKLQTAGYGAALKILFEFDETKNGENPHLRRTELVALINTMARISHSLTVVRRLRSVINDGQDQDRNINISNDKDKSPDVMCPPIPQSRSLSSSPSPSPSPQEKKTEAEKYEKEEDIDFDEFDEYPDPTTTPRTRTISEDFWEELDLVWRAYKYVLYSWISLPATL